MKICITGGAGFIGSHLTRGWVNRGADVVVLDNFRSGRRENLADLQGKFQLIEGSVTDPAAVCTAVTGADFVFHLAALVSVPESVENPRETVDINCTGFLRVLEAARDAGVRKVVLSSSAAVYGFEPPIPSREADPPDPLSPYAVTKLDGEYYARLFQDHYGLPTTCLRYFNVFGEGQRPDSQYAAAIPAFASRACRGEALTIFGDGEQTRDFIHVSDVVRANILAAEQGEGVYNVARGEKTSIRELAEVIVRLAGTGVDIRYAAERSGDVKHSTADTRRIQALGFHPEVTLEEGLQRTVAAFMN